MRIAICCFSGTGNTLWVAKLHQKLFEAQGSQCDILLIEDILSGRTAFVPESYDITGIAHPIHAWDAPAIVTDFIAVLPGGRYPYFLFKTAGSLWLGGGSSHKVRLMLANKGWSLRHEAAYQMPANMMGRPSPQRVEQMVQQTRERTEISVSQILDGTRVVVTDSSAKRLASMFNLLESKGCKQSSAHWKVKDACNMCQKCVRECPTGNISTEDGHLKFNGSCVLCLRCWWNCPVRALSHPRMGWTFNKKGFTLPEV